MVVQITSGLSMTSQVDKCNIVTNCCRKLLKLPETTDDAETTNSENPVEDDLFCADFEKDAFTSPKSLLKPPLPHKREKSLSSPFPKSVSSSKLSLASVTSIGEASRRRENSGEQRSCLDFTPTMRSGGWTDIGKRDSMEDAHVQIDDMTAAMEHYDSTVPRAFYGVFDGHCGSSAANYMRQNILRHVMDDPAFPDEMELVFRRAFEKTDIEYEQACASGQEKVSGTTALTVMISGKSIVVANAGDCRAVLSRRGRAVQLSNDQKPESPSEKARIEAAGGFVEDNYLNGHLGVARALGDWNFTDLKFKDSRQRPVGPLSSEPEVKEVILTSEDEFLIIGCDGLWDVFSSQNAVEFARSQLIVHNDPIACSKSMVDEALRRDTRDNLTVVTVCFRPEAPPILEPWKPVRRCVSSDALSSIQKYLNDC